MSIAPKVNAKLILALVSVCFFILAANFFVIKEQEKLKRVKAEENLKIAVEEKKAAEDKLVKVTKDRDQALQDLSKEKEWSKSLEGQLKEKEKQVQEALNKLEEKEKLVNEALAEFESEKKRSAKLEEDLKRMDSKVSFLSKENIVLREMTNRSHAQAVPAIELEKIVVTSNPTSKNTAATEGKVFAINKEYNFIIISLGASDVKKDDKVLIIRDGKFIAQALVAKVEDQLSAASLLPEYKTVEIKEGDIVRLL